MDNKALLDQLMGKDRNAPTFKGIAEQWKDPTMCKPYILEFCPYELFNNTKMFLGNCRCTHSDIVKQQYESSTDKDKSTLTRKYELDLLTHLERIIDSVDSRVRKHQERINATTIEFRLPPERERELDDMNKDISLSMKQVEKLAEQGMLEESSLLMSKVEELNKRVAERRKELESKYFKKEAVCDVCSALSIFGIEEDGSAERINDHLRGRQHSGVERTRMKIVEIKQKYKLPMSRRDRQFVPSETIQHELKREGIEVVVIEDNGSEPEAPAPEQVRPATRAWKAESKSKGQEARAVSPTAAIQPVKESIGREADQANQPEKQVGIIIKCQVHGICHVRVVQHSEGCGWISIQYVSPRSVPYCLGTQCMNENEKQTTHDGKNIYARMRRCLFIAGVWIPVILGSVVTKDRARDKAITGAVPSGFVVATEDGSLHGFDSCGDAVWVSNMGRTFVNATEAVETDSVAGARMIPAIDGSLYVVFPPDLPGDELRIAHVNATIMSVVAESPFSTPAFPNAYLTGSKVQSFDAISFDDGFSGWLTEDGEARSRFIGRKLIYSVNEWTLSCIDTSSQRQKWSLSFCELPGLTQSHLNPLSPESRQVARLSREIEISTKLDSNKILKKVEGCAHAPLPVREIQLDSQILGVYAILDPSDTNGNLALALVAKNWPIPTNFGGLPQGHIFTLTDHPVLGELTGVRVDYAGNAYPLTVKYDHSSITPYNAWPPANRPSTYVAISEGVPHEILSEYRVVDFLRFKFGQLSMWNRLYLGVLTIIFILILRKIQNRFFHIFTKPPPPKPVGTSSISILLPDGTHLHQTLPEQPGSITISSPTSTNNRLVLIPSEAIQPYEVVKVGQSDSVEFLPWQLPADVDSFERKIKDISQRLTKLPFTHSARESSGDCTSRRPSLDCGNATVLFLGRNVDEPKLVFRNPRAESEIQRPNVPVHTQSIRNAVAASALRDSPNLRAYVPRALCGTWNTFQGVFQEYIPKNKGVNVSILSFTESPESAVDTAFLVMLLRDTDAHDGNYIRDLRRKIALFDLGCSLGDKPLPNDPIDRLCLDNFEIWKRLPFLLDVPFQDRHRTYIEGIDWAAVRRSWSLYEYQDSLVEQARAAGRRLVHPTKMVRMMELHANFLTACMDNGKTVLFAAEVMYSGLYDDLWITAGEDNLGDFQKKLIEIAKAENPDELFPHLAQMKGRESPSAKEFSPVSPDDTPPEEPPLPEFSNSE